MLLSPAGKGHHCSYTKEGCHGGGETTTGLQKELLGELDTGRNR